MDITNHRWGDEAHTVVLADQDGATVSIPADSYMLVASEDVETGARTLVEIAEFVAPDEPPVPVPSELPRAQFAQVLALDKVITEDEAFAYAARGDLPKALTDALAKIPAADRFSARMALARMSYDRNHPLVPMLGQLLTNPATGKSYDAAALDGLWIRGNAL